MLRDDGWARVGWTGVVTATNGTNVKVQWDSGTYTYHYVDDLRVINSVHIKDQEIDPNTAFALQKKENA